MTVRLNNTPLQSSEILKRLSSYYAVNIDLSLRQPYRELLEKLGNPQLHLPPVIHVAGTNGKGSTVAFLRAMLEAAGLRVHVYTSPHLVSFHERIRLAGEPISESSLCSVLLECEYMNAKTPVTLFEITTASAFLAFSRIPADVLLLEVGLGGRLDATNVIDTPIATAVTRISYDHREFLGDTLEQISAEKAGIFKTNVPAVIAPQFSPVVIKTLNDKAMLAGAIAFSHGTDWSYTITPTGFDFMTPSQNLSFPKPSLLGEHQYANAATAIAILKQQKQFRINDIAIAQGLGRAYWPARLQRLTSGPLVRMLPSGFELWLDGGHNDSAGDVLARQAEIWRAQDAKPLLGIVGMLATKNPAEFLAPLSSHMHAVAGVPISGESKSHDSAFIASKAQELGIDASAHDSASQAVIWLIAKSPQPARILITGSLYLAGHILRENAG